MNAVRAFALLLVAAMLLVGPLSQAQTNLPRGPQLELGVERTGAEPQWVDGSPSPAATGVQVMVTNSGDRAASYTLAYEWVGADGTARPLNEDAQRSLDVSADSSHMAPLGPGSRTHDPMPWRLQDGQAGPGHVRVTAQYDGRQAVEEITIDVAVHQLTFVFEGGDLALLPGETGFLRGTLRNEGNVAEPVSFSITDAERKDATHDNTQLRKTLDPATATVPPQGTQQVVLYLERAFDLAVGPFSARFTVRATNSFGQPLLAATPTVANNETQGGLPDGFSSAIQAAAPGVHFVPATGSARIPVRLANLAAPGVDRLDDTYRITAIASDGWGSPASQRIALRAAENATFDLTVQPPAGAKPGARSTLAVTATSDHTLAATTVEVQIQVSGPAVRILNLQVATPYMGDPGQLQVRLANTGDQDLNRQTRLDAGFAPLQGAGAESALDVPALKAGQEVTLRPGLGTFTVPGDAVLQATWSDPAGLLPSVTQDLSTFVHSVGLRIVPPTQGLAGVPGEQVGYRAAPKLFRVVNEGNAAETVAVTASASAGSASIEGPTSFQLGKGESRSIPVLHLLPLPSGRDTSADLTLAARIQGRLESWNASTVTTITDRSPPHLELVTPVPALWSLGEPLVLAARVSDDGAVASVEVNVTRDGSPGSAKPLAQVGEHWNALVTFDTAGNHTLRLQASDAAGNVANLTVRLRAAPVPPPLLQVEGPADNATAEALVLRVMAIDTLGIASVTVREVHGNGSLEFQDPTSPLEVDLAPLGLTPGTHHLSVEAVNSAGARVNQTVQVEVPAPPEGLPAPGGERDAAGMPPALTAFALAAAGQWAATRPLRAAKGRSEGRQQNGHSSSKPSSKPGDGNLESRP